METNNKTTEILNDLIRINNDRKEGYDRAAQELPGSSPELKAAFNKLSHESQSNAVILTNLVKQSGGNADDGTSASGTLHRAWLDVKAMFTGHDETSILEECERGEDAIIKAYKTIVIKDLSPEIITALSYQQREIMVAHDLIKTLRDQSRLSDETLEGINNDTFSSQPLYNENMFQSSSFEPAVTQPEPNYSDQVNPVYEDKYEAFENDMTEPVIKNDPDRQTEL